jgi:serine/threonine protein kinase/tetratricopeptide (TPR) repeat protein
MPATEFTDPSLGSAALRELTEEQKDRLTTILDRYLSELERGVPPDPGGLVAAHPDLAAPLQLYLDSLNDLHGVSAGFTSGSRGEEGEGSEAEGGDAKRLGDFILGREIGRGGMGVVYEARQISLDRRVALKELPFAAVLDSKQLARFKNEAQAAAQLHHPNIVPVFAIGAERGVHYYAMQFIEGQPLDQAIRALRQQARQGAVSATGCDGGALAAETSVDDACPSTVPTWLTERSGGRRGRFDAAVRLGIDAAEALHAAHEYGVVHRDIKPSNLLLDEGGKIWITDFGLARCQNDATLTRTGDVVGTMRYMSPEQARGQTTLVDYRTDIYSLAVTLYELLSLQPAVPCHDDAPGARPIGGWEPQPLRKVCPEIPADLETVVMKAMSPCRDDRYATAQEFADDLRRVRDGRPTLARPPTVPERLGRWALRHRRVVRVAAGICLCAVIGFALSTFLIAREKLKADYNFERAERRLRDAHDAVDRFGAQLAEKLASLGGAETLRREVLQDTLRFYSEFIADAADDPTLQDDLALTYSKIGMLNDQIGSTDEAIGAHQQALDLFSALVAAEPGLPEYRRRLAMCHNNLALTLRRAGRIAEAWRAYHAAIALQRELVDVGPAPDVVGDLALTYTNLGLLQSETGNVAGAGDSFREAIRLQEQLLARDGDNPDLLRQLAASYNNRSAVYLASEPAMAAECYRIALRYQAQAVAHCPADLRLRGEWALTYSNLGAAQSRLGDYSAAAAAYDQAIAIQQQLAAAAPAQTRYRRDLAVSYNNRGLMQSKLDAPLDAEQSFSQALALQRALVAQYPDDLDLQSSLGGVYNNLGIVLEELQRMDDAVAAYRHAVEHQHIAFSRAADVSRFRVFLSKHYYNYGRALRQLGYPELAIRSALARRDLWPDDPQRLFSIAEELALAGAVLQPGAGAGHCVDLAVETLRQAVDAGLQLPADLRHNESFAALRDHVAFVRLTGN